MFKRIADGSEGSSFSFGNDDTSVIIMLAISGADTTTPFDIDPTWSDGASAQTAHIAPSISPTGSASLLVCGFGSTSDATSAYTPPSGMSEQGDAWANFAVASLATLVLSASGATGTKTATHSTGVCNEYTTLAFAIKAAGAAAAAPRSPLVAPSQAAIHAGAW